MRKTVYQLLFLAAAVAVAFLARTGSTGLKVRTTAEEYLSSIDEGRTEEAWRLLSDSLSSQLVPELLDSLRGTSDISGISTGGFEDRGIVLSVSLKGGGSRTLWAAEQPEGNWSIAGDSSLDNLLGRASMLCLEYAREIVQQSVGSGDDPSQYTCPVSGRPYFIEEDRLICPAGHLGEGLEFSGASCQSLRDSLAGVVEDYLEQGFQYPSSFSEMYSASEGEYGQRGGFRCPDHGYSYYEITAEGVYCPYHEEVAEVDYPGDSPDNDPMGPAEVPPAEPADE
ncbi:MAG: hypothetical protein GF388_03005 [Candidatus Aegiribacteria sp.]|nr:hypothetical protein [Candidatus Aegiribacteria sp.]MBD3294246.1 hypothetical protein [Candidatus Fermentibacteria bacterium]